MKIQIIDSMKFSKEMLKPRKELGQLGHIVNVPIGMYEYLRDSLLVDNFEENLKFCIENDITRKNFQQVVVADVVLVVNHKRNNIEDSIGISALIEMSIAHLFKKEIFLLDDSPSYQEHPWAQKVAMLRPIVLKGDLQKIK